ncbi:MAG: hypothetical protein B7C24_14710 [Bacteroidetes bacterium 4572_77]|nr:MAG: hypothetical protein B7C24_14710 [Bacteroidetes bacterium 4572_77]
MQINNKTFYIVIILIVVSVLASGWYFYEQMFQDIKDPISVIPDDVALLMQIPDFEEFVDDWQENSTFKKVFQELPYTSDFADFIPEAITQLKKETQDFSAWETQKVCLSIHTQGFLLLLPQGDISLQELQSSVLSVDQNLEFAEKTINEAYYLATKIKSHPLYISQKRGLFIVSNDLPLLSKTIENTQSFNSFSTQKDFAALQKVRGKRALAHLFVNYNNLAKILAKNKEELPSQIWGNCNNIAKWTGLDLHVKSSELMLSGYTIISDSGNSFLEILKKQEASEMSLIKNFPYATHSFQHLSISDYEAYYEAWQKYLENTAQWSDYSPYQQQIDKVVQLNHKELQNSWWTGEMAMLSTEKGKEYAVFSAHKGRESFNILSEIAHLSQPKIISKTYKGIKIKEIRFPYYLYLQFGPWFKDFKYVYFAVIDEIVVFSSTIKNVNHYIDLLQEGYVLSKNQDFNSFSDNISKRANYTFYTQHLKKKNAFLQWLPANLRKQMLNTALITKNLNGLSVQLNWKNNMIYTGVFASLGQRVEKKQSQWQVYLDSDIVAGPYMIKDHTDGSHKYIVFDEYRQMYLINSQGDIQWKKQWKEKPIGDVFEIDYYKNGKIQYLFNTENYIYLVDLTGNLVENYPISLNSSATASLSVVDYNANKDYRILIPTANGKVYNYKKEGSLLKDWKAKNTRKTITKPIKHIVANSKDYLVAEADNGNIVMFNRKGEIRMEIRKSFANALGSDLYANRTNSKGMMVTTDEKGKFVYIPEKGKVKTSDFGDFSPDHYFFYTDFSGNGDMDFIYVDGNELQVFDRFKKTIISYVFEHPIVIKPQLFSLQGRKILGVQDLEKEQVYLFNSHGIIQNKIEGNSRFIIDESPQNDAAIIIGKGKSLVKSNVNLR